MTEEQERAFEGLMEFAKLSGWIIAIPKMADDDDVIGLVMGTEEYVDDVLDGRYKDDMGIFTRLRWAVVTGLRKLRGIFTR